MNAEAATYARELSWLLAQLCACVIDLTPSQLAWRPDTGSANSAYAIAHHVGEVTRVYALGFGCGGRVTRDRSRVFSGTGDDAGALIARLEALGAAIATALATLSPADLGRRQLPPRELWGEGEIHEISARDALVESIRHAGVHLGELRLTRDLALRHA
jgi:hypothetical protein